MLLEQVLSGTLGDLMLMETGGCDGSQTPLGMSMER